LPDIDRNDTRALSFACVRVSCEHAC
jgi:hypothetical protein